MVGVNWFQRMRKTPIHGPGRARLLVPALLGVVLGGAVQLQQRSLFSTLTYCSIVAVAVVFLALAATKSVAAGWRVGLAVLAFSAASLGLTGLRASVFMASALEPALEGRDLVVTGVVAAMPQRNEASVRFRLEVESAQFHGQAVRLPPLVYVLWYADSFGVTERAPNLGYGPPAKIVAGERWQLTLRLKAAHGASNPFGFDYELWLWEQGLQASGYVRTGATDQAPRRLSQTWRHPLEQARQSVRERIFERVADRQSAGLIAALVVGDQNAIDRADWDVFRASGVAHLMSISGLHITMFAWASKWLLSWLWRRSGRLCLRVPAASAALVGGLLLAGSYAAFSGWGVPSQRTVLMLATVGALQLAGKRWPWPQVWLLACAVVVALDPWALLQSGFWLSFVAVGVLFATDSGQSHPKNHMNDATVAASRAGAGAGTASDGPMAIVNLRRGATRSVAGLGALFREQWVITLALTPLTLLLFGQVSVVGLVANMVAIPWVTLVVTPLAMLGVAFAPAWDAASMALAALLQYLQLLVTLPFATLSVAQAPLWAGVAGVLGGVFLAMRLPWSLRLAGVPLMLPVLLWQPQRPAVGEFELLAADVGQGSAVIVRTAHHALVYDAGPRFGRDSDAGHRVLVPLLRALDLPLDLVVLSHRDIDHTGGAPALLAMQPQAALLSSIEDDHDLQTLRRGQRCVAGMRWQWDGVDFAVLHPTEEDYKVSAKSNAMSCTLRVASGGQSALFVGDLEEAQELRLVAQALRSGDSLKSDVLLVPHHGSKNSSSAAFVDAVRPRFALVQAGYRNRFSHPAPSVVVRYEQLAARVVDSPHCGAMIWRTERAQEISCQREQALRYWHHRLPTLVF